MNTFDPARFQFIADALSGSGPFASGSALVQHAREPAAKFARRQAFAWYANALRPACQRFVGYLVKRPVYRQLTQPALQEFLDNCAWQQDSLDIFWSSFMVDAKARGSMLLLIDMPKPPSTRTVPYLIPIAPEQIKQYVLNAQGQLTDVTIQDFILDNDGKPQEVLRRYTDQGWIFTGAETGSGEHGLGACPVLAFTETGGFPSTGEFAAIADLSLNLYRRWSLVDEILNNSAFPVLTYKVPADKFPADLGAAGVTIGTNNILQTYDNGAEFISPPEGLIRMHTDCIDRVEALIRQAALIVDIPGSNSQESGVALQLRFQALNASLVHFARRMEDFERRMWDIVGLWLGIQPQLQISWGKDFSIADLKTEIEVAQNMAALGAPDAYRNAKLKQLVQLDLGTLPDDDLGLILGSIDEAQQEVTLPGDIEP